ncbi:glycosyltransferase [Cereibacter sphaeroides]|uniref:glycosyltransferase family 2 protein n=1 Tax=Cereibacter sphaeroides TaxID=1063 RepID=UPI001F1F2A27|nr:glycosyltransferase family 2 protein [Cereibacter sphaeroides]MCE6953352.1 glycosyltransferase [Cereibacter sphaeroides]
MTDICVIIAAHDASATVAQAVRSALTQPEVAEVVVIDDASGDATAEAARAADDGTGRLTVERLARNAGPSAARNRAIAVSRAPRIAILDADDFLLPGRFARLDPGFDLAADNIVFVTPDHAAALVPDALPAAAGSVEMLDAERFALGNLAQGVRRGELGFLKPVMARAFLDQHGLRYDEGLWLGEDFDLYMRMLLRGARFGLIRAVGYVAIERSTSLSGRHRTADLAALEAACLAHLDLPAPDGTKAALRRHLDQVRAKVLLRRFLDRKAEAGLGAALGFALAPPSRFLPIARGIARDKISALRPPRPPQRERLLLPVEQPS